MTSLNKKESRSSTNEQQKFHERERSFIRDSKNRPSERLPGIQNNANGKLLAGMNLPNNGVARPKPNIEIYRPPGVRKDVMQGNPHYQTNGQSAVNNIRLTKSRTSLELTNCSKLFFNNKTTNQNINLKQQNRFDVSTNNSSFGPSALHLPLASHELLPDVTQFPDVSFQMLLKKIANDPDASESRSIIEVVKKLISVCCDSSRYASITARYCSFIIEKETKETFFDSLLNICQNSFTQQRTLRASKMSSSHNWVAFMNFLSALYLQLKRCHFNRVSTGIKKDFKRQSPDLILLILLSECCLTSIQVMDPSPQEFECVFFILTSIGREIEAKLPNKMSLLWNTLRDIFLEKKGAIAIKKTLLQLIELRACNWKLPATAVTFYYPYNKEYDSRDPD